MLTITPRAMGVIRRVTAHPRLDPESGLRIAPGADGRTLQVRVVSAPEAGDRVLKRGGGRLYLGPAVTERIAGSELDVETDARDRVQFVARSAA